MKKNIISISVKELLKIGASFYLFTNGESIRFTNGKKPVILNNCDTINYLEFLNKIDLDTVIDFKIVDNLITSMYGLYTDQHVANIVVIPNNCIIYNDNVYDMDSIMELSLTENELSEIRCSTETYNKLIYKLYKKGKINNDSLNEKLSYIFSLEKEIDKKEKKIDKKQKDKKKKDKKKSCKCGKNEKCNGDCKKKDK